MTKIKLPVASCDCCLTKIKDARFSAPHYGSSSRQTRRRMAALRDYNAAVDFVDRNVAEGRGDKTACIDPARNITYGELRDAAARIGPMLARLGIEPENRIALVLLDTVDFPILFLGAVRAGIIPVLLNTRIPPAQYR